MKLYQEHMEKVLYKVNIQRGDFMFKLDPRIKSEEDIFNPLNGRKAEKYLGKTGYFFSCVSAAEDLSSADVIKGTLTEIDDSDTDYVFVSESGAQDRYFIPEELLRKKTVCKYRPYTMEEFIREYSIGEIIFRLRDKRDPEYVYQFLYIGHSKSLVYLGAWALTLQDLFDHFEEGEGCGPDETWHPFGVLDVSEEYIEKPKRDEVLLCSKEEKNH